MEKFKFIDFHTHPFLVDDQNLNEHISRCNMGVDRTKELYQNLGKTKIVGSVLSKELATVKPLKFDDVIRLNDTALELEKIYDGFYIPGFHIHPKFVKESISELERLAKLGKRLIGEIEPHRLQWADYTDKGLWEILEAMEGLNMIFYFHAKCDSEQEHNQIDQMVKRFKNLTFVGAHFGPAWIINRQLDRVSMHDKYYVDTSSDGLTRLGTLRHVLNKGAGDRVLFGSNFPIAHPGAYAGSIELDEFITREEKDKIFYKNAEKLLGISLD